MKLEGAQTHLKGSFPTSWTYPANGTECWILSCGRQSDYGCDIEMSQPAIPNPIADFVLLCAYHKEMFEKGQVGWDWYNLRALKKIVRKPFGYEKNR